jgi:hypothetical protein
MRRIRDLRQGTIVRAGTDCGCDEYEGGFMVEAAFGLQKNALKIFRACISDVPVIENM